MAAAPCATMPVGQRPQTRLLVGIPKKSVTLALTAGRCLARCETLRPLRFRRHCFRASHDVAESKVVNGEGDNENSDILETNVALKDLTSMKNLIQAYKKAIIDGDQGQICELESVIVTLEKERNSLSLKITETAAEINSGREKLLRLKADFENFRKKAEKDCRTFTSDVQGDVVESLLPVVDSFERTKQQLKPETETEKKMITSYLGIYKQFVDVMRGLRVSVIETVGKPFDPSIHEAVAREESQQLKEGIVIHEVRRGFVLGERVLRPATVKVSTGPGLSKSAPATEQSAPQHNEEAEPVEH